MKMINCSINKKFLYIYNKESKYNGHGHIINPELCFYEPRQIKKALTENQKVLKWLRFISNDYIPYSKKILLIYPCSTIKPYNKSRSYHILFKTLCNLGQLRSNIHLITISEPFGLIPEEFYGKKTEWHDWENDWYDCPGLFEWWCKKNNLNYEYNVADECIDILSNYISNFFKKIDNLEVYSYKIALVRTFSSNLKKKNDHTHRRMLELAKIKSGTNIEIIPDINMIKKIINKRGKFAWDMYGVAHPIMQQELLLILQNKLKIV